MNPSGNKIYTFKAGRFLWVPVALLAAFYFFFDPAQTGWMPQCVFHKITGLQCMGCGTQRMLHALLHGEFKEAFMANAFVFCSLPFLGFLIFVELKRVAYPKLYKSIHSLPMIIMITAMLMAWLFIRNIYKI